jgi:uncharacterized membrane protein YfcA
MNHCSQRLHMSHISRCRPLVSHAVSGLLTRDVALATAAALPGTIGGAWIGSLVYRRLGDRGFQKVVMGLLLVSGLVLIATSW